MQSTAEPVVDGEESRDKWAIRLVARKRAEGRGVAEEERNISQLLDGGVVYDGVRIVEVKAVLKMIGVSREEGTEQKRACQTRENVFAQRDVHIFEHKIHSIISHARVKCRVRMGR